jgi:hypothetical protein
VISTGAELFEQLKRTETANTHTYLSNLNLDLKIVKNTLRLVAMVTVGLKLPIIASR